MERGRTKRRVLRRRLVSLLFLLPGNASVFAPELCAVQGEMKGRTNSESGLHLSALPVFIYPELGT